MGGVRADGTISPIGNVFQRIERANDSGIKKVLLPKGQRRVTIYRDGDVISPTRVEGYTPEILDMREYASDNWGIEVIEIETIYDAISYVLD